ncbi:hypothetical protein CONLIGDRAFT_9858 [Coniochaeta ligniaria NRRL 30616]|uniref:Uncharacterized protein n=1 Tax=Coniochaeta ligniaria NRRL 30616 TaxID=1408157 RepID=A0A1J7JWT1_9PEZI|nr:hypothetical protein CONLIGDRAFT_9858 [Coniochaeta ligniaria NRRL 30616]
MNDRRPGHWEGRVSSRRQPLPYTLYMALFYCVSSLTTPSHLQGRAAHTSRGHRKTTQSGVPITLDDLGKQICGVARSTVYTTKVVPGKWASTRRLRLSVHHPQVYPKVKSRRGLALRKVEDPTGSKRVLRLDSMQSQLL